MKSMMEYQCMCLGLVIHMAWKSIKKGQGVIPIFIQKIIKEDFIEIWREGNNKRKYIYIDEIIELIEREVGKKAHVLYKEKRRCDLLKSSMDVSLIHRECGWKSKLSVEEGIKIYVDRLIDNI